MICYLLFIFLINLFIDICLLFNDLIYNVLNNVDDNKQIGNDKYNINDDNKLLFNVYIIMILYLNGIIINHINNIFIIKIQNKILYLTIYKIYDGFT